VAEGKHIVTYGTMVINLDLFLRLTFKRRFVIADNEKPIIGMDFLSYYGLLVDPRDKRLLYTITQLSSVGYANEDHVRSIKTIIGE
jgi:hypothetical protein